MRIVVQKRIVQVIQQEIVQYKCDRCGTVCGTKENKKETWYSRGKSKHYCKKTCSPRDHPRVSGEHVMYCELCLRDAEAENDPRIAEWTLMALKGKELRDIW